MFLFQIIRYCLSFHIHSVSPLNDGTIAPSCERKEIFSFRSQDGAIVPSFFVSSYRSYDAGPLRTLTESFEWFQVADLDAGASVLGEKIGVSLCGNEPPL